MTKKENLRSRIIAFLDARIDHWLSCEDLKTSGKFDDVETTDISIMMANMAKGGALNRVKIERPGELKHGQRREIWKYKLFPQAANLKPLAADRAANALASPPRGPQKVGEAAAKPVPVQSGAKPAQLFPAPETNQTAPKAEQKAEKPEQKASEADQAELQMYVELAAVRLDQVRELEERVAELEAQLKARPAVTVQSGDDQIEVVVTVRMAA